MNSQKNVASTLAPKPTQKNGEQPKTPLAKEAAPLPVIIPEKRESAELPSIESRLKKLVKIQQLVERRELLLESITNLQNFYIAPDGNSCNLRLQDSKGKTFAIAHPVVIGEMVSLAKGKLTAELEKIESQIDFNLP